MRLDNPILKRTLRRATQAGIIVLVFYLILVGGFILGVREYQWRIITLVLLTILFGGWLGYRLLVQKASLPETGLEIPLLLMLIASILATIFSTDPRLSAGRTALNFALALSLYFTLDWLRHSWRAELLLNAVLLTTGVVCLIGLTEYWQWYGGDWVTHVSLREAGGDWHLTTSYRIKSVLHNPNYLAYFLIGPLSLILYKSIKAAKRWQQGLWIIFLLLVMLCEFLTQSRGGLLGALTSILVMISLAGWSFYKDNKSLLKFTKIQITIFGLGILLVVSTLLLPIIRRTDFSVLNLSFRESIWQSGLNIFYTYPLFGAGPATFPAQYLLYRSASHGAIFTHAHNVWLTILAEYGVVGLVSVALFFAIFALKLLYYLRQTPAAQWSRMVIAGISLLLGQAAHNLVDDFMEFPVFSWFTILGIALCLAPILPPQAKMAARKQRVWLLGVVTGSLLVLGGSLWFGRAFAAYEQARAASYQDNWLETVNHLEQAVQLDPAYTFYRQQLALAYGELARTTPEYLNRALTQQKYVRNHSTYATDIAYLACLYWESNQPDQAIAEMQQAVAASPSLDGGLYSYHLGQKTFIFNLGRYFEALGEIEQANLAYEQLVAADPKLQTLVYWQESYFRPQITRIATPTYEIKALIEQGAYSKAEILIKNNINQASNEAAPTYYTLWGYMAELQGNNKLAIESYELAIANSLRIRTDYANLIAQRQPLATELPFCLLIPYPADHLSQPSLALAQLWQTLGEPDRAIKVYQTLLRYEPFNRKAKEQLNLLQITP